MILIALGPRIREAWSRRAASGPQPEHTALLGDASTPGQASAQRTFTGDDALTSLLLFHLWPIARWKKPEQWPAEMTRVSRDVHAYFGKQLRTFSSRIPPVLGELTGMEPRDLSRRLFASFLLEKVEMLACSLGRYDPNPRLVGGHHLQKALSQGHGAVLWCEMCFSASLMMKAAVASAGFQVHHLSRPGHNLSNSRFGLRFLNSIVRKAEDRYLAERIVVDEGNTLAVSRQIMGLLSKNSVVSVTVLGAGSQIVEAPLLDSLLRVATGAPHFALRSGAPLLPLVSYREAGECVVEIGEPISLGGLTREKAYGYAVSELARRLDGYVRAHPYDWAGWMRAPIRQSESGGPVPATS